MNARNILIHFESSGREGELAEIRLGGTSDNVVNGLFLVTAEVFKAIDDPEYRMAVSEELSRLALALARDPNTVEKEARKRGLEN